MKKYRVGGFIAAILTCVWIFSIINLNDTIYLNEIKRWANEEEQWKKGLQKGEVLTQTYKNIDRKINKLVFSFERLTDDPEAEISVTILNSKKEIVSCWSPKIDSFDSEKLIMPFFLTDEEKELLKEGEEYHVQIVVLNGSEDVPLIGVSGFVVSNLSETMKWTGTLQIGDSIISGSVLNAEIYSEGYNTDLISDIFMSFVLLILLIILVFVCNIYINKHSSLVKALMRNIYTVIYANRFKILIISAFAVFIFVTFIYHILFDIIILSFIFLASLGYGMLFLQKLKRDHYYTFISMAVGFCVIGVAVYYILTAGIGCKEVYAFLLALPIFLSRKALMREGKCIYYKMKNYDCKIFLVICFIILLFYLALGSAPIDSYDALVKHLPISIYAVENGAWYSNIIEDIVAYSESTMLPYGYSTILVSFGCYKALCLLNVFLFFIEFAMLTRWAGDTFGKLSVGSRGLWLLVYFLNPYMMNLSTKFMADIIAMYITLALLLCIGKLTSKNLLRKIPVIAFLAGCIVFTKLTILPAVLFIGIIVLVLMGNLILKRKRFGKAKKTMGILSSRIAVSIPLFLLPFIFSFIKNWYMIGNPFSITAYNQVFKSPYFSRLPFSRPFQDSGIADGLISFWNIVFHTNDMVESADGSMGVFLLLFFLIPLAVLAGKNIKLFVWALVMFFMLQVGGIVSGNLRYNLFPTICMEILIVISIQILCLKIKGKLKIGIYMIICIITVAWNVMYIHDNFSLGTSLTPSKEITKSANKEILERIPKDSRVFSFTDDLKGEFRGFYFAATYRNDYVLADIYNGEKTLEDMLLGFDYALYKKNVKPYNYIHYNLAVDYLKYKDSDIWHKEYETNNYILYKINQDKKKQIIFESSESCILDEDERMDITVTSGFDKYQVRIGVRQETNDFEYEKVGGYSIETGLPNEKRKDVGEQIQKLEKDIQEVCVEILWRNEAGELVQYERVINCVFTGENGMNTGWLARPKDAVEVDFNILNINDFDLAITDVVVEGMDNDSLLDKHIVDYYNREALK